MAAYAGDGTRATGLWSTPGVGPSRAGLVGCAFGGYPAILPYGSSPPDPPPRTSMTFVRLAGSGSYLPEARLSNHDLWEMASIRANFDVERARGSLKGLDDSSALSEAAVFDAWAQQVTGIEARRVLTPESGLTTEALCAGASSRALEAAGLEAGDLDLIFVCSLTGADEVPNMACTVAAQIGAPHLGGYTLNAACAGFVYGFASAVAFIRSGAARHVLVVSGDALSHITDYSDPKTAVLFGDGAGAVVLSASDEPGGVLGVPYLAGRYEREPLFLVGQGWESADDPHPKLQMGGGPRILRSAIASMTDAAEQALQSAGLTWDDVDLLVPHQANLRITMGLEKQLRSHDVAVLHTIQQYGNMSASTVPVALDEALRGKHGPLPAPATIVLTSIGGGYTTAAAVVRV